MQILSVLMKHLVGAPVVPWVKRRHSDLAVPSKFTGTDRNGLYSRIEPCLAATADPTLE